MKPDTSPSAKHPSDKTALKRYKRETAKIAFGDDVKLNKKGEVNDFDAMEAHR